MLVLQKLKFIFPICCFFLGFVRGAEAGRSARPAREGKRLYSEERYAESLEKFQQALDKESESVIINFNAGAAAFRTGAYGPAARYFRKALLADDASFRREAAYNLGNALYYQGRSLESADPAEAGKLYEEALRHYESVPEGHAAYADAAYNADIVRQALEQLRKTLQSREQRSEPEKQGGQQQDNESKEGDSSAETESGGQDQPGQESAGPFGDDGAGQEEGSPAGPQNQDASGEGRATERSGGAEPEDGRSLSMGSPRSQDPSLDQEPGPAESGAFDSGGGDKDEAGGNQGERGSSAVMVSPDGLTKDEAQMLLNEFIQKENPGGLLNWYRGSGAAETGYNDW
jgi:hypothetical protein